MKSYSGFLVNVESLRIRAKATATRQRNKKLKARGKESEGFCWWNDPNSEEIGDDENGHVYYQAVMRTSTWIHGRQHKIAEVVRFRLDK